MYQRKDKRWIWKLTGIFFAGMILFTLLSRAAYQHGTAVVTTDSPKGGTIGHTVRVTGKTLQNQEQAVTTVGGLRVASVCVNEGQQVAKGDVLFTLDLDYLAETVQKQKAEMQIQSLNIQDAWSQSSASQKQRANQQAQAAENYDSAVSQAQTAAERAERDLERAEAALENFYNGVTEDRAQEEALTAAWGQAQSAYETAQAALDRLRQEMENKVLEAQEKAKNDALQSPLEPPAPSEEGQPE